MVLQAAELRDKLGGGNIFGAGGSVSGTMVPSDQGTLVSLQVRTNIFNCTQKIFSLAKHILHQDTTGTSAGTFVNHKTGEVGTMDGTMINYNTGTSTGSMVMHDTQVGHWTENIREIFFVFRKYIFNNLFQPGPGTAMSRTMSELESTMGTMVINESENNTMNRYGTAPGQQVILASDWSVAYNTELLLASRATRRTSSSISTPRTGRAAAVTPTPPLNSNNSQHQHLTRYNSNNRFHYNSSRQSIYSTSSNLR